MNNKKFVLGQYFTKKEIVNKLISLLLNFRHYSREINILEPSSGTGNFVKALKEKEFYNVAECEIDELLTANPCDFLIYPLQNKFDLIIGNPPFTKYNLKESYYHTEDYKRKGIPLSEYLPITLSNKEKFQIENAFILKSIKHLKDKNSSISFVLPISFFIAKKNKEIKKEIMNNFSTIIIYQNDENWFDINIPCCFAIFTNIEKFKDKIILLYEDGENIKEILDKNSLLTTELIPKTFLYKRKILESLKGKQPLSNFLSTQRIKCQRDYKRNNISGANILEHQKIPEDKNVESYVLAVTRVGNVSVGKTGLINLKEDILNDMFFVFPFKEEFNKNRKIKETICKSINENQEYFKNITHRVGSKSIKKNDIFDFRIQEP